MGDFKDLGSMFQALSRRPTAGQMRAARGEALKPFVVAAKSNLASNGSNKTGKLSASLGVAEKQGAQNTTSAGPIRGKRNYSAAVLVEFGTAPHWQPNRGGGQMHPGARAKPFMRPAFEQTKDEIARQTGEQLLNSVLKGLKTP